MKIRNGDQRLDPFQPSVAAVDQAWSETQEISERGGNEVIVMDVRKTLRVNVNEFF